MTPDDFRDTAKDTSAAARDTAANVGAAGSEAASNVADKARDSMASVSDAAGGAYEHVKGSVSDLRDRMPDSASDAVEAGRRAYAKSSKQIGRQVAKQPIEALLLAGAIGYLVGWAANRS